MCHLAGGGGRRRAGGLALFRKRRPRRGQNGRQLIENWGRPPHARVRSKMPETTGFYVAELVIIELSHRKKSIGRELTSEHRVAMGLTLKMGSARPGGASRHPDSRLSKPVVSQLPSGRTRPVSSQLAGPAAWHVFWARKPPWKNMTVGASAGTEQS